MASTQDDIFGKYKLYSGIAIGGVLLALVLDSCSGGPDDEIIADNADQAAPVSQTVAAADDNSVEKNLAPVEKLAVVDKSAPETAAPRSGEAVYQAACMACHAAGVLNAPKLEPGAWDDRIGKGLDGLTHSAINGINSMPPRGGNPTVTDEEITSSIAYMLSSSGYDIAALDTTDAKAADADNTTKAQVADAKTADADATEAKTADATENAAPVAPQQVAANQEAPAKPAAPVAPQAPEQQIAQVESSQKYIKEGAIGKQVYQNTCFTCHDVGMANAPMIGDSAAWQQRAAAGIDALYSSALNGKGVMPPKAGNASLSKEQVMAAVDYMLTTAGVTAAQAADEKAAPAAAPATDEKAEPAATQEAAPAAPEAIPAAVQAGIDGEKIYRGICFSCHDMGIANAPKLGDKAVWASRIAAGTESLYNNSINGKGVMPARGGNPALSDDEIKAAVDWMVQQSQ